MCKNLIVPVIDILCQTVKHEGYNIAFSTPYDIQNSPYMILSIIAWISILFLNLPAMFLLSWYEFNAYKRPKESYIMQLAIFDDGSVQKTLS